MCSLHLTISGARGRIQSLGKQIQEITKMKTETFAGTVENAYGQPLSTAIKFSGSFEAYESIEEVKEKNEYPKDSEIVSFVNAKSKASKRQAAMTSALEAAGITKPDLSDSGVQLKTMVKVLVAAGKSEDQALQIAKATLGL